MTKTIHTLRAHRTTVNVLLALVCFGLFGAALYFQHVVGLEPCPLCIFQRIAVVLLGIAFVLAALVSGRMRVLGLAAAALIGLVALGGAGVAARHVYIQSLPPGQVPVCGMPYEQMREMFSAFEVLQKVITGSGECGKIDWTFLGLSMPAWVLIAVLGLGTAGVLINWRSRG